MNIRLFDDSRRDAFLPLAYTRPVADLRIGILTIAEKWAKSTGSSVDFYTQAYLSKAYPAVNAKVDMYINGRLIPTASTMTALASVQPGESLHWENSLLAWRPALPNDVLPVAGPFTHSLSTAPFLLHSITDLFTRNKEALELDFDLLTRHRASTGELNHVTVIGPADRIFLEEGAVVTAACINTTDGPVYLAKDTEVMEGSVIRGPFSLGEHSSVKMGAKVYGATTIGPHCKVGGELSNSVFQGFSNKAHDGFLGNSVIGEWCNLGADTNSSNLKNNYSGVRIWDFSQRIYADSGLTFCGLIMGDHSKCGINTMFNTGTTVGVSANIFGAGFPPKYIPSFAWGGVDGWVTYSPDKALETASRVMSRRHVSLTAEMRDVLTEVFRLSEPDRAARTQSQE